MKKLLFRLTLVAFAVLPLAALSDGLQVADAKLGKGVQDREITEEASTFAVNEKVYLWLRLTGGPADNVNVDWKVGDSTDTVSLKVGGDPWRTWSNKTAWKAGDWTVTVTDAGGQVLKEMTFKVE
jgi:hypothetical protein